MVTDAKGIVKVYGSTEAVRGVDLQVSKGELYGLIGPDGAGKSSIMKIIAGVLAQDAGDVRVFGTSIDSEASAEAVKSRLGFMPQGLGLNLYADLSVEENIDFFAKLRLVPSAALKQRKAELLSMTRLKHFKDRPMKHLSGGMKQKLGLICSIIHEPELLILDEPTTGVDPVSRRDFWSILHSLIQDRGITALVSTAYLDEADRFTRVALLHRGKVLLQGTPEEMRRSARGSIVSVRAEPSDEAFERLRAWTPQIERRGDSLRVFVGERFGQEAISEVTEKLSSFRIESAEATDPDLEDTFIALLRRDEAKPAAPSLISRERSVASAALAIEARDLSRVFDSFRAVDSVSFQVRSGEIFGLLGANGAGKTTVIKMLTGIIPPSSGSARVGGIDVAAAGGSVKTRLGYMSQAFSLYQDLTVLENLRLYAGIYGISGARAKRRVDEILDMADLHVFLNQLSGRLPMGVRQRLALGCALIHEPQVLFLDEPTSGVDPLGRRSFWEVIYRLAREKGVGILVTTHYMSEAEHCDHIALMYAGRAVEDASPAELKARLEKEVGRILEFSCADPYRAVELLGTNGFSGPALLGSRVRIFSKSPDADLVGIARVLALAGISHGEVRERPFTMEDVFVHRITGLEQEGAA